MLFTKCIVEVPVETTLYDSLGVSPDADEGTP